MWRKHLTLGLLTVIAGIWFASWQGYTPHLSRLKTYQGQEGEDFFSIVRDNLRQHLNNHHHLMVSKEGLKIAALPSKLFSAGDPYVVFFSAKKEDLVNHEEDLYTMQVHLGSNAYPISFTPPRNLTENPLSKDQIFDLRTAQNDGERNGIHLLFGQIDGEERCRAVSYLHWDYEDQADPQDDQGVLRSAFAQLVNAHLFDRATRPQWLVTRFKTPVAQCHAQWSNKADERDENKGKVQGRGIDKFDIFSAQSHLVSVDVITQSTNPIKSNIEVIKPQKDGEQALTALQEALRVYDLLNLDEDLSLSSLKSELATGFEKNLYELLVNQNDASQHQPVGEVSSILDGRRPNWYPPRIDVKSGFPREGQWRPIKLMKEGEPLLLKTYIRLDKEHPYHSIHLYALDMRRLGIRFVAGGDALAKNLEGVGSGKIKNEEQRTVMIAFNGGPSLEQSHEDTQGQGDAHGVIQDHHILVPPTEGLPTLALDHRGRLAMGRLDVDQLPISWSSIRQSYAPLVDLRIRDRKFVSPQSPKGRLDHLHLTRSALGINQQGTLIYAWSEAASAPLLAQALRLVGVKFAMSLRSTSDQNGIAIYPDSRLEGKSNTERATHQKMQVDPQKWREGSKRDFFYFVLAQSLPHAFPQRPANWREGEGVWKMVKHQDVNPWLATSFVNSEHVGSNVELLRIDGERLQVNFSLGGHRDAQFYSDERPLPAEPIARIPLGFATKRLGIRSANQDYYPPVLGKMTWAVDEQGKSVLGRWGQNDLRVDGAWQDLVQGEGIIDEGKALTLNKVPSVVSDDDADADAVTDIKAELHKGGATGALGATLGGDLIFAYAQRGDIKALQMAMIAAGVQCALRINYQGTSNTGHYQFFYRYLGQTFYNSYPDLALKPAALQTEQSALLGIDDALIITPKASLPRARFVESFKELEE